MIDDPGLTPGFVDAGNSVPIESYYEVPKDSSAPHWCCLRDVVVSRHEFTIETACAIHGPRSGGNAD